MLLARRSQRCVAMPYRDVDEALLLARRAELEHDLARVEATLAERRQRDGGVHSIAGSCTDTVHRGARSALARDGRTGWSRAVVGGVLHVVPGVVTALAVVLFLSAALAVAVLPAFERSRERQARADALTVASAAQTYLAGDPQAACPTTGDLVRTRVLSRAARTTDPWANELVIDCGANDIVVWSAGLERGVRLARLVSLAERGRADGMR